MNIRSVLFITFIIVAFAAPTISRAATNAELLQQIASLLAQVQALQNQLQTVEGSGTAGPIHSTVGITTNTQTTFSNGSCISIAQNLKRGDSGVEVSKLQTFLAQDKSVYPEGEVSGYYGALTEAAVQRWQASHGVVSSGTAATTGYGAVGPKTRAAMQGACSGSGTSSAALGVVSNGTLARPLVATPEVGALPLQVTVTFSLNGSSCTSYALDWGDGTAPLSFDAGNSVVCSNDIAHKRATHTYTTQVYTTWYLEPDTDHCIKLL